MTNINLENQEKKVLFLNKLCFFIILYLFF